jgi:DNA-binding transcriptional LysR family regulator
MPRRGSFGGVAPPPSSEGRTIADKFAPLEPACRIHLCCLPITIVNRTWLDIRHRETAVRRETFARGQLQNFVTVAEEGQMTRAARRLHMAQPALSQAISRLEAELGVALLERHPRGVSLTTAGEVFLPKARAALAAAADAARVAQSLARVEVGRIEVGYVGPPAMINAPELFVTFCDEHPELEVSFRELSFPTKQVAEWLEDVDVAFCHSPAPEPGLETQAVRTEPRAVIVPRSHPLAQRETVTVEEVLDEVFLGYHADVQREWAGFHCLDDHRGAPARLTRDRARTPSDMLTMLASLRVSRPAIAVVPLSDAMIAQYILRGVVAIPVSDAAPAVLSLTWRGEICNPDVAELLDLAKTVAAGTVPRDPEAMFAAALAWGAAHGPAGQPVGHGPTALEESPKPRR